MTAIFQTGKRYVFWNDGRVEVISVADYRRDLHDGKYGECKTAFTYGSNQVICYAKCDVQFLASEGSI